MRSGRVLPRVLSASFVATAALLQACSSPNTGGAIGPGYEPSSSGGASNNNGSSSGGSSSGGSSSGATSGSSSGSSSGGTAATGNTISADATWANGMTISEATTIAAGVTVTIAKGATINVAAGVVITVAGTLTATAGTPHAILTGTGWTGMVIPAGGTITADSLDITGAATPMDVTGNATYDNATITGANTAIDVEINGTLSMTGATITGTLGESFINGAFTASHLDYERGPGEGVQIANAASVVKIDNSTFHGTGDVAGDMIISNACESLTMTYTAITGCHCAYHFGGITSFDIENMDINSDSYGFMMYGSSPTAGTRVFKNSNVETEAAAGIDESGTNGAITVSGVYFDTSSKLQLTDQEITISDAATSALPATSVGPQ